MYVILDGFDLGAARSISSSLARTRAALVLRSIGPVWTERGCLIAAGARSTSPSRLYARASAAFICPHDRPLALICGNRDRVPQPRRQSAWTPSGTSSSRSRACSSSSSTARRSERGARCAHAEGCLRAALDRSAVGRRRHLYWYTVTVGSPRRRAGHARCPGCSSRPRRAQARARRIAAGRGGAPSASRSSSPSSLDRAAAGTGQRADHPWGRLPGDRRAGLLGVRRDSRTGPGVELPASAPTSPHARERRFSVHPFVSQQSAMRARAHRRQRCGPGAGLRIGLAGGARMLLAVAYCAYTYRRFREGDAGSEDTRQGRRRPRAGR